MKCGASSVSHHETRVTACRGLPVDELSRLQILIAYWGFGLHWGEFPSLRFWVQHA